MFGFFQALDADAPCLDWGNFGMQVLNKKKNYNFFAAVYSFFQISWIFIMFIFVIIEI